MFSRELRDISSFRREFNADEMLGGEGVDIGADDCAVVRDDVDGIRIDFPGVVVKLGRDASDKSIVDALSVES